MNTTTLPNPSSATSAGSINVVQPYLFFNGRCEEALEFYTRALGAKITMLMRYHENPDPANACAVNIPGHKIMHASFRVGGTELCASDGMASGKLQFEGFSLSVNVPDAPTAQRVFAALAEGGEITMPLGPTFYSPSFGMLTDRFGVGWMVIVPANV